MEPLFDKIGALVGWIREDVVYSRTGIPRGFLSNHFLVDYEGLLLGYLSAGYLFDLSGMAIAHTLKAIEGPKLSIPQRPAHTPCPAMEPPRPTIKLPSDLPSSTSEWSARNFHHLFERARKAP